MPVTRRFGYLPLRLDLKGSVFEISSLDTLPQSVAAVDRSTRIKDGWFYPSIDSSDGIKPHPAFTLPMTHEITLPNASPADVDADPFSEYLIATVGFLHGILLIPDGWLHLARVKVDASRTHDYHLRDSARERVMHLAAAFWQQHPGQRQRMFGALHWHCSALAFMHDYETFAWQYTVLDACWFLHALMNSLPKPNHEAHEKRIVKLAQAYQLKVPASWDGGRTIIRVRNELLHEARWGSQSIGFGANPWPSVSLVGTLIWFNTRVILGILGETGSYIRSDPEDGLHLFE